MVALWYLLSAFAGVALLPQSIAHSVKRAPLDYVTTIDNVVIKTPSKRVHWQSSFDITFTLHDGREHIRLALEPNHDVIHPTFAVTYMGADGNVKSVETIDRADHKVFKGRAFVQHPGRVGWWHSGWARITVHRDGDSPIFDGTFMVEGNAHNIQTAANYNKLKHDQDPVLAPELASADNVMVVWRSSDISAGLPTHTDLRRRDVADNATCGSDALDFNIQYSKQLQQQRRRDAELYKTDSWSLFGRQTFNDNPGGSNPGINLRQSIGQTAGCPSTRRVALVGIATDCNYWAEFDGDTEALRNNVVAMVHQASELYENTFNISLGLQNLTVTDTACPSSPSDSAPFNFRCEGGTINERLSRFSEWRGRFEDTNAYWTLMTSCNTGQAVGLAWRGQLCRQGSGPNGGGGGTIAAANVVVRTPTEWQIFAHETGHTFGAVHDCTPAECPYDEEEQECCPLSANACDARGRFMMNPSTRNDITQFSPCSIGNICAGLANNIDGECLTANRNIETVSGALCGNGIVELGEECDCGGEQGCGNNPCCDAATCQFVGSAVCDPTSEECCTDQCRYAGRNTVCRASTGECDPAETCSGNSGTCPTDEHLDNGASCGDNDNLQCASGQCTSRDLQCRAEAAVFGMSNVTRACDDDRGCRVTCSSDSFGNSECAAFPAAVFLDGTPCRGGGRCQDGECQGSSSINEIMEWINNNLNIFIPIVVVVGLLILSAILSCIWSCCRRGRQRARKVPAPRQHEMRNWPAYRGGPAGPPPQYSNPQVYSPVPNGQEWGTRRQQSTRYA
ncbi:ADAM protease ADM-B [Stachybotrys elegans]|uniref:Disintegrin and metalloproteinase domain-containing protein B n=1 Tax=Stachybotrys elegans TaxID=80388 RepID=A0A8K0ST39_9HYPO|nr:ADAM protease ADM-B [Stachybotrys elegans]